MSQFAVSFANDPGGKFVTTITDNDGDILVPMTNGNFNVVGQFNSSSPSVWTTSSAPSTINIEDRTSTTGFVVDSSVTPGSRGTYSDIQSAINAAVSGQTIFIKDGVYTQDLTLQPGVNLVAYGWAGLNPNVTIAGTCSLSGSGAVTITGIRLQTNGNYAVSVTGSVASRLYLVNCFLDATNFTHFQLSSSSSSSTIRIIDCWISTGTDSFGFFTVSGAGGLTIVGANALTTVATAVQSEFSSSNLFNCRFSSLNFPITTSGTGRLFAEHASFNTATANETALTIGATGDSGGNYLRSCIVLSGTASAVVVNSAAYVNSTGIYSTDGSPISGSGTLRYTGVGFMFGNQLTPGTGLTLSRQPFDAGILVGNFAGTTVLAGNLGEYISASVAFNSVSVPLVNDIVSNITSIDLTPGTWDVSGIVQFTGLTTTTYQVGAVTTSSATIANSAYGNNAVSATFSSTTANDVGVSIPAWRISVTPAQVTRTIYLVAQAGYTVGSGFAYGRISATRVC